ncbi:hypothetical protein C2E23DRAFT_738525 [Lenzites betulinus]|nr:hypothetical protein C2E23DRAFT_738525 [Lenzites betulinus]
MAPAQCTVCDEKFKSKSECNIHRAYVGHGAPAVFFCVECSQTFVKLKELKNHRNAEGHTRTTLTVTSLEDAENVLSRPPGIAEDWRPPLAIRGDNAPAIRAANCPTCCESFKTHQELAAHRRTAHGQEIQVAFKCPRCAQAIPLGEVHGRCTPPVRPACAICRQRFGSTAELVEHRLANPVSCDICAVHLPQWLTLQEHWRVSNQHPYCELCDNAFKNQRAWVAHTLTCSLARSSLTSSAVGETKAAWKQSEQPTFHRPSAQAIAGLMERAWISRNFPNAIQPTRGEASRHSSHPSLGKLSDSTAESSSSSRYLAPEEDVSNIKLAEEYGQENITRILSVVEDDDPVDKPRVAKSLLSASARSSEGAQGPSLLAECSTTGATSRKENQTDSPPMLGYRREPRKPAELDADAWESSSDSPSEKVTSWLDASSPLRLKPGGISPLGKATTGHSWQCRLCLRQPCAEPVASTCGHLFCQSCIVRGLETYTGCPACQTEYFVPLSAATTS